MQLNGVQFSRRTRAEIDHMLWEGSAKLTQPYWIVTANAEMLYHASYDPDFRRLLNQADEVIIDGSGPVFAIRSLYHVTPDRISGTSLVHGLATQLQRAPETQVHVVLTPGGLTSKEQLIHWAQQNGVQDRLTAAYPEETTDELVRTKIVFITLGSPKQEEWIAAWIAAHHTPAVYVGIGGAIDTLVGTVRRTPSLVARVGLEWLWRLMIQPKRIIRIFRAVICFPLSVLLGRLRAQST